jgi:hypothetical protein
MVKWAVALTALTVAVAGALAEEPPTRTGDVIGTVFMRPDLSLSIILRSVQCDGTLAEGILEIKPGAKWSSTMLAVYKPTKQSPFLLGLPALVRRTRASAGIDLLLPDSSTRGI